MIMRSDLSLICNPSFFEFYDNYRRLTTVQMSDSVLNGASSRSEGLTRIVFVGDVHNQWLDADEGALRALHPHLTVYVGDIGDEAVELVREIAKIELPKAVILGNHDSMHTPEPMIRATLDPTKPMDAVNAQLEILGDDHIGFSSKAVPNKPVTIVGARPFAGGAGNRNPKVVKNLYGYDRDEYAQVIANEALAVPDDHSIVMIGHNGPSELGDRRYDLCGVDFHQSEGDGGDADFRDALEYLKEYDRSPCLVVFGHMHHRLISRYGSGFRRRVAFDDEEETVFFNVAVVPRVIDTSSSRKHHFSIVEIYDGKVIKASDAWVSRHRNGRSWNVENHVLFRRRSNESTGEDEIEIYDTHLERIERIFLK